MHRYGAWLKLLCFALPFCVLTTTVASAYLPQEPAPGSGAAPINLGEDEAYRRQGTLANMKTCLAVADDDKATALLNHRDVRAALSETPIQRAEALRTMTSIIKRNPGYGTLLACTEIVSAWHSRTLATNRFGGLSATHSTLRKNDGRFEHSAFVIDLAISSVERAMIAPVPLARLLTSPGILPPSAYGGIVVKNAIVDRPMILHNLSVIRPIAFINVRFSGGTINQALYNLGERTEATAVVISSARLEHQLVFAGSTFCGSVAIREAHFKESLTFRDVEQFDIGCAHRADSVSTIALRVDDSRFEQNFSIVRSRFAAAAISGTAAEKLAADRVDFGRSLLVEENALGSMQFDCTVFAQETEMLRNRIDQGMSLEGTAYERDGRKVDSYCREWWAKSPWADAEHKASILVENNRIDGGLTFRDFAGTEIRSPVRLKNNNVSGRSLIATPAPISHLERWVGDFDVQGSRYEGTLELQRSAWRTLWPTEANTAGGYCAEISKENKLTGVAFQLRATFARTLRWNLPLTCDYRWLGYGLSYDLWIKGKFATESLGRMPDVNAVRADHIAFEAWRKTLRLYEPSSLTTVSEYLAEKGEYVESREVLLEAKRLNYVPNCPPDQWMPGCAVSVGGAFLTSAQKALSAPRSSSEHTSAAIVGFGDHIGERFLNALEWLWRLAMLILLWPGGYGAQPERAFLLLLIFSVICWLVYKHYTNRMREQLLHEWRPIDNFLDKNADRIARTIRSTEFPPGLAETQMNFEHLLPGNDRPPWIAEDTWKRKMGHEERLREVQGPLLDRVRAWEDTALETDVRTFRDFRERLERFGNTEIAGFGRFDANKMPKRFTERIYSFDTMLPVIDLHAYSNYYPIKGWVRFISVAQHVCGWWWVTVFIASAAIL
ncbi:MAG: hypothetical protein AAF543_16085 [Pseudomonadota bacterium]